MKKNKANTWALVRALLLLLAGSGLCLAEDFTFNVPVALYNIPPGVRARVSCTVLGQEVRQGKGGGQPINETIGTGYTEFSIANGTFVGTVVVKFNSTTGMNPANAKNWICKLFFNSSKAKNVGGQASVGQTGTHSQRMEIDRLPDWLEADRFMSANTDTLKPVKTMDSGVIN